jgi:hypothetical protein
MIENKGVSPFYPGQPVPVEFFIGRRSAIEKVTRSLRQVEHGKPQTIYLSGEYGIGKSSLAAFMRHLADKNHRILGVHVFLGGAKTLADVATKTVEAVIKAQAYTQSKLEKAGAFLSKYVGKQELFGFSINLEALKADGPAISQGFLPFLQELLARVKDDGTKGLMLIFDEINGISKNPEFAHFVKGLVDENALSRTPVPLLLMICGVEKRRMEMVRQHQPVERIFDIIEIQPMGMSEMRDFFSKTFGSQDMTVEDEAMAILCNNSGGFPKIMHIIGDTVFWIDQDNIVDSDDAIRGIVIAAEDIGKKFVDQQVYRALRSEDYHSILRKLGREQFDLSFKRSDIERGLSESEKKKLNNFLQRMKRLDVLRSGEVRGEYVFNSSMVRIYILLNSL